MTDNTYKHRILPKPGALTVTQRLTRPGESGGQWGFVAYPNQNETGYLPPVYGNGGLQKHKERTKIQRNGVWPAPAVVALHCHSGVYHWGRVATASAAGVRYASPYAVHVVHAPLYALRARRPATQGGQGVRRDPHRRRHPGPRRRRRQ